MRFLPLVLLALSACHSPATYRVAELTLNHDGTAQTVHVAYVTPHFFQTAGDRPFLGRLFLAQEYQSSSAPLVIISHLAWRQRFKADLAVIGTTIRLNDKDFTVIGVMPPSFDAPSQAEFLLATLVS